jgi:hypothetical protein
MNDHRAHLARILPLAVIAAPVTGALLLFDQSASSTAAWAGMVVAAAAAGTMSNTGIRRSCE